MSRVLLFLSALLILNSCRNKNDANYLFSVADDFGNVFTFAEKPKRVISLAPGITESIYYINAENSLIGVTNYCDFPPEAANKTKIGGMIDPNTEIIANLNPDIIFITTEGNSQLTYRNLKDLGYRVFVFNPGTVKDIYKMMEKLNEILMPEKGSEIVKRFSDSISVNQEKQITFAGFISVKPLITFNSGTFINDIFLRCGFINVYGDEKTGYPSVSDEDLSVRNPEYLMIMYNNSEGMKDKLYDEIKGRFGSLRAVKENKVIFIDESVFSRPGPRVIRALGLLKNLKS
jgi:iron complex transport system substrate-binding protein